jgi:hypothetical protein
LLSPEPRAVTAASSISGNPARSVTVPVHTGDLKRGALRGIIAQAGLTVTEFIALL